MTRLDVNGNTKTKHAPTLRGIIYAMTSGTYRRDGVGRVLVDVADGGSIVFFAEEEPRVMRHLEQHLQEKA